MDMYNKISQLLADPAMNVDPQWVLDSIERYPSYYLPAALLLARNPESVDEETRRKLKDCVIINCPDRTALADLVDLGDADWSHIYPREEFDKPRSTEDTIDTFIETYGTPSTPDEDAILERLIFNPEPPDYFQDTDEPFDPNDPLALPPELDPENPVELPVAQPEPEPEMPTEVATPAETNENNASDPSLMESLAKIFIKQRRYQRAYEIIGKLSLNYPEKSVYFADQLRFLEKLMINQSFQNK